MLAIGRPRLPIANVLLTRPSLTMTPIRSLCSITLLAAICLDAWCGIPESEYRARRANLLRELDTSSACALKAIDFRMRSNDVEYRYRQESNILYLTGISEPGFALLASPGGIQVDGKIAPLVLLCQPGLAARVRKAGQFSDGLVVDYGRFADVFADLVGRVRSLYVSSPDIHFTDNWLENKQIFQDVEVRKNLQSEHPGLKVRNAAPLVSRLRQVKSDAEVDLIRKAIDMTGDGIRHAMNICKPGAMEYELQAALEYEMVRQGADAESFPSIVASGPNSIILHYSENRRQIRDGDVIVMDVGAEFEGYAADITRTFPASGKFTPEQKKIYRAVLKAQHDVIDMIAPGVTWSALNAKTKAVLAAEGFADHTPHPVSHHVGLDVHDPGQMDTLRAGMVITVEPGVYIPETDTSLAPAYRGVGVRIEDDVLVTDHGARVLSGGIPSDIKSVQRLVDRSKRH